jgi:nitrogenase molybdenum-cofactor synthesis protein NifE
MIVLQPIADTAHLVHGPIACCGNTWEGRGTLSSRGDLHTMGFTTDMGEIDIVYGSEEKLLDAIRRTFGAVRPKAIFVYATCVSGMTGEDIDAVCKQAEDELDIRVIPVNAPGFVGPKNLGNRIAGEVLLEHVIGTGETPVMTHKRASGTKDPFFLILYPRTKSGYPEQQQADDYARWFKDVQFQFDRPFAP